MRIASAERKKQLIAATVELMRRDGIQRLTVRGIAEEAGANLATVSYCFIGKDDLLRHAFDHWLHRMLDVSPNGSDASQGLTATARRVADAYWKDLEETPADVLAQLEAITWAIREAPQDELARTIYEHSTRELASIFQAALDATGATSTMTAQELASAFLMLIDGASLQYIADPGNPTYRTVFDQLLNSWLGSVTRAS